MNDRFKFRTPIYAADGKFKKFVYWPAVYGAPAVLLGNTQAPTRTPNFWRLENEKLASD